MNPDLERAIQDELDGVATPEQSARLREVLARDPEARARWDELERVVHSLEEIGMSEAPDLRHSVLRAIDRDGQAPAPRTSWLAGLREALGRRPGLAVGYAFAAGAVVSGVAILLALGGPGRGDRAAWPVSGEMASPPAAAPAGRADLEVAGARVSIEAGRAGDTILLEVDRAEPDVSVTLGFAPEALSLAALRWDVDGGARAIAAPGSVTLGPGGGRCRLELRANVPRPGPITVLAVRGTTGSARATLAIASPGEVR